MIAVKKIFLILILFSTALALAQPEAKSKPKSFPIRGTQINLPTKPLPVQPAKATLFSNAAKFDNLPPLYNPNNLHLFEKPAPFYQIKTQKEIDLAHQPIFDNPNGGLLDKLNQKNQPISEDFKAIRGNQDLGNFTVKSKFVKIKCRDFGDVDGDEIRIYLNGNLIESRILLISNYQEIQINLEKGFNKIEFEAISQGLVGPNTADFKVYDDIGVLVSSNQWNLATGFKASIMIVKE